MKRLSVFSFLAFFILASALAYAEDPAKIKLAGFVNDYADVLTPEQELSLTNELKPYYDNGTAEIAIVTVKNLGGYDIESFTYKVSEGNIGNKELNNGLVILISVEDRKYRFEVGRGLEPYLNDAKVGRIGRNDLVPYFKEGDYYTGLFSAVQDIKAELDGTPGSERKAGISPIVIFWIVLVIIMFVSIFFQAYAQKYNNDVASGKRRKDNDSFLAALIAAQMLRGGRGGSGGSFGGFGGGSFGGGGASGGW